MNSLAVLFTASKARFMNKHSELVNVSISELANTLDDLPLVGVDRRARIFWGWPPIAVSIRDGAKGLELADPSIQSIINSSVADAAAAGAGVQRAVYRNVYTFLHSGSLVPLLVKRCEKYLQEDNFCYTSVCWSDCFHLAHSMSGHVAVVLLKTVTGAWITNRRTQAPARFCIFCNQCEDSLQHLAHCDILWKAISTSFLPFLPSFDLPSLFGLLPPSPTQIFGVYIAFQVYHSLRHCSSVSYQVLLNSCPARVKSSSIASHLIKVHLGLTSLKYTLPVASPAPHPPSSALSSASHTTTDFPALPSDPSPPSDF